MMNFVSYAKDFHLDSNIIKKAIDFQKEFDELTSENLSLDEFKTKYLDFKQRHDEFAREFEFSIGDKLMTMDTVEQNNKPFKPIQSESKNKETYKDEVKINFFKNFLEVQKENGEDILELLLKLSKNGVDIRV